MTKKVDGYAINHGGWIEFDQAPDDNGPWVPCTMVIADKAHERVFTESEVKAMLKEMEEDYHTEASRQQFVNIAKRHGIALD